MTGKVKVATPVGELHWCQISGQGKKNYNEDGYVYQASVFLAGEQAEDLKAKIEEVLGEPPKGKNVKSRGYRKVFKNGEKYFCESANRSFGDEEGDEETEYTAFTFTTQTTFEDGRTKTINVFNSGKKTGKPENITKQFEGRGIGNGSRGAISGNMQRFERGKDIGVSLFLNSVQITKYIEYSGDAGFDAQEDGDFEGIETDGTEEFSNSEGEKEAKPSKAKAKPKL